MTYNILVVDDSVTVRKMIAKTLDMAGVPIKALHQAENGKTALEILDTQWIDLVITDINMPEMDGVAFVRHMSAQGLMDGVAVMVVSTEGSETRIAELKALGVCSYIRKPFTPKMIKEEVENALGAFEHAQATAGSHDPMAF